MSTPRLPKLFLRTGAASVLALVLGTNLSPPVPASAPAENNLQRAFGAILGLEDQINARYPYGTYVSQTETSASFAARLAPFVGPDYVGVSGLGLLTPYFGYQPTNHGPREYGEAIVAFRTLLAALDPNGTADWIHTLISGHADGSLAQMVLNFEVLGSPDPQGVRQPIGVPHSLFDPNDSNVSPAAGRCICICRQVMGQWQLESFYFVLTPQELLH